MRNIVNINADWHFTKETVDVSCKDLVHQAIANSSSWESVSLPHCWNAIDGQDGGGDYHRGTCFYVKEIVTAELPQVACYYLEIRGANSSADVYADGAHLAHHDGGYSTWRVDMTQALCGKERVALVIAVDNSANETVYPQMADFTFYGGLYRDVNLICVEESHFDLSYYGGPGIQVTPVVQAKECAEGSTDGRITAAHTQVAVEVYLTDAKSGQQLVYTLKDAQDNVVAAQTVDATVTKAEFVIENAHLWHGRKDPYLYTAQVELLAAEETEPVDVVTACFGCRTYQIDPERGFILNGEEYPLRGVSRH